MSELQKSKRRTDSWRPGERGKSSAWVDIQVEVVDVPRTPKVKVFPENREPEIVWLLSGETVTQERVLVRREMARDDC